MSDQIAFRYRAHDSATGVSRKTVKRMAELLDMSETQTLHHALRLLAVNLLPQYEQDNGALTAIQVQQIKERVPQGVQKSVRSSLFDLEPDKN